MTKILVVDDEKDIRELISDILNEENFEVVLAANGMDAINAFKNNDGIEAVVLDIWLEGSEIDGLGVLENIINTGNEIPVIMISGHATIELAVQSIKMGAYDFIQKPFAEDKLVTIIKRSIENFRLKKENLELRKKLGNQELIGKSQVLQNLRNTILKLAQTSSRVMITGASGSGKKLVAEMIHAKSKRAKNPFIVFRPIITEFEKCKDEITNPKNSVFVQAEQGTLFVDEVTNMSIELQNIFLRQLQQQGQDVRVIASTSKNIEELVKAGMFRQELYHRLNVMQVSVPSLSERKEDIPMLCDYFINQFVENSGLVRKTLSNDAIAAMQLFEWPGNIRQLRNIIEWLLIMVPGDYNAVINSNDLPSNVISSKAAISKPDSNVSLISLPLREAREIFEKQYLAAQVERFSGNISRTSNFIGMERSALHRKLKSLNIISDSTDIIEQQPANDITHNMENKVN